MFEDFFLFSYDFKGCNKAIMGEYVNANGKKYHKTCYSQDIQCASCSKMIFGEILQACGKFWYAVLVLKSDSKASKVL